DHTTGNLDVLTAIEGPIPIERSLQQGVSARKVSHLSGDAAEGPVELGLERRFLPVFLDFLDAARQQIAYLCSFREGHAVRPEEELCGKTLEPFDARRFAHRRVARRRQAN